VCEVKIEALTVSVDYSDFLAHSILWNHRAFDRWVIVTAAHDQRTRDLCEHHHIECVTTDAFYSGDRAFAKAAGINAGLAVLDRDGWVAHLDADIVLPPRSRGMIEQASLDPSSIWGCDRLLCESYDAWACYVAWPEVQHSVNTFIQAQHFPLGPRVGRLSEDGWSPIGFFQLWNPIESGVSTYPDHGNVDRSDMAFARQWPRHRRGLIPELVAIHLASEPEEGMGANWRGRKTKHFGPEPHPRKPPQNDHHHRPGY
jgi:hypothetical protein